MRPRKPTMRTTRGAALFDVGLARHGETLFSLDDRLVTNAIATLDRGWIGELVHELSHCDVVINLAGAPINKRWTLEYQQEIISSRVQLTHRLVHALDTLRQPPNFLFRRRPWVVLCR